MENSNDRPNAIREGWINVATYPAGDGAYKIVIKARVGRSHEVCYATITDADTARTTAEACARRVLEIVNGQTRLAAKDREQRKASRQREPGDDDAREGGTW